MKNRRFASSAIPLALLLCPGGLAAQTQGQTQTQQQERQRCTPPRDDARFGDGDILPLLDVRPDRAERNLQPPVGGYVHLWVEDSAPSSDVARCYGDETRNWLHRLFVGRNLSRVLQAKVSVTNPGVIGTTTLAASTRTSTRSDGEIWTTELSDRRILTPYFRVDPGTTVAIDLTLSASSTISGDITRNILSVIEQGARLASPTSAVVTSLTSDRLQNAANFVDRSISNLFGQKLSERSQSDFRPGQWFSVAGQAGTLATVEAAFPMGNDVWDAARNRPLGTWRIRVSAPIISVFSAVPYYPGAADATDGSGSSCANRNDQERQACIAFAGLTPATVLTFRLTDNVTLGDALRGDAAISSELSRLQAKPDDRDIARRLCSLIASKAEGLGLNRYDAAATLWAFAADTQLGDAGRNTLLTEPARSRAGTEGSGSASLRCGAAVLAGDLGLR